jgi:hypothetical protein
MKRISFILLLVACLANASSAQVTLRPIGSQMILFNNIYVEYFGDNLYTIDNNGALYKTDLNTGEHTRLGNVTYKHTRYLFGVNGQLYCMEDDGSMNRIDPVTGAWTVVSIIGAWKDIDRVVVVGRNFYTTQNGVLYLHPTMNERLKKQVGGADFFEMGHYFRTDTSLYSLIGGTLYRINLYDGKWTRVGDKKGWKGTAEGDVIGNKLYTFEPNANLYETDLSTGTRKLLDDKQVANAELIFAVGGKLYVIYGPGQLAEIILPK